MLVVGCILNTFIRRADRVRIACIAQLVNAIAPITTEPGGRAFRHTHLLSLSVRLAPRARRKRWPSSVDAPRYDAKAADDVPYRRRRRSARCGGRHDRAVRRSTSIRTRRPNSPSISPGFPAARLIEHILIHHPDLKAVNSADAPDVVKPQKQDGTLVEEGRVWRPSEAALLQSDPAVGLTSV